MVTVEFNAPVVGARVGDGLGFATIGSDRSTVVFDVSTLEDNLVDFEATLDLCGSPGGAEVVASVSYSDNEGNTPDLSVLESGLPTLPACGE